MILVLIEVLVLLGLILLNGALAASEISLVTARSARLRPQADAGDEGAGAAMKLMESPNEFLSTVQIGITALSIVAGAFGGTAVASTMGNALGFLIPPGMAAAAGIVMAVCFITYVTVVFGELLPKRLALAAPESTAARLAPFMTILSRAAMPVVHLLSVSVELVFRVLPQRQAAEPSVTEEEVRTLLAEAKAAGVLDARQHDIVERILRLRNLPASAVMTARDQVEWIDLSRPQEERLRPMGSVDHARFVLCDGELDRVRGYVNVSDMLARVLDGGEPDPETVVREPHLIRPWDTAFHLLEVFQESSDHIALVLGEGGRVEGVVTLTDILECIVGDLPVRDRDTSPRPITRRENGSLLVDGVIPFGDFLQFVDRDPPAESSFPTLHAFMVGRLGKDLEASHYLHWKGLRLEVVDMDGTRVDKVLVSEDDSASSSALPPLPERTEPEDSGGP